MGASKRIAEVVCQAYAAEQTGTCISIVRFGNVLWSSGSVLPRFKEQIPPGAGDRHAPSGDPLFHDDT